MANLFDYLDWRGNLGLQQDGFNHVDGLILCRLAYLPFDGILAGQESGQTMSIADAAAAFLATAQEESVERNKHIRLKEDLQLLKALISSPRFAGMQLGKYVNELDPIEQKQFAALTVLTGDQHLYVAYRGTDGTLVGWKEDLNMSFMKEIPAQGRAVEYLHKAAADFPGYLRVGGHSKGGNLAVYAGSFCQESVQSRITCVYNHDGPGFLPAVTHQPGYQKIQPRVHTFVPQSSVVGMLLCHEEEYTIVESAQKGLMQHNLYSWQVMGNDFVCLSRMTEDSIRLDQTLKNWLAGLTPEQREQFVDGLYDLLQKTNADSALKLTSGWVKDATAVIKALKDLDEPAKKMMLALAGRLPQLGKKEVSAPKEQAQTMQNRA